MQATFPSVWQQLLQSFVYRVPGTHYILVTCVVGRHLFRYRKRSSCVEVRSFFYFFYNFTQTAPEISGATTSLGFAQLYLDIFHICICVFVFVYLYLCFWNFWAHVRLCVLWLVWWRSLHHFHTLIASTRKIQPKTKSETQTQWVRI